MKSYHTATFGGHKHCGSGDMTFSICHMILQGHMTQEFEVKGLI